MNRLIKYIVFCVVITLFSSCYTRKSNNLLQERSSLPTYEKSVYENYMLQKNDELVMRVISRDERLKIIFPSQSTGSAISYRIYDDGTADFPLVSRVPLVGKTLKEAEKILTDSLSSFAKDIIVKMALKTSTFCVIGAAGRGYFPIYKERLTIFQALAMSGGMEQSAKFSEVKIVRTLPNETVIKTFDIRSQSIIDSEFYYVQPNDIIYCDYSKKKFWGTSTYVGFFGIITSSVTFALTVWNLAEK